MNNFTVENIRDSGSGSLRQAIEDANNTPGTDRIEFNSGLSGQEIILTNGELSISDGVEISGGANNITINGNNASRVFTVDDFDAVNQSEVIIDGLTLTEGSSSQGGGAIANSESLTISQSNIVNNENTSLEATDGGGAIRNSDTGSLNISQSSIARNQSSAFGGGITNFGELNLEDSFLFDNEVTSGGGAGLDNRGSTANIADSLIANNTNTANPAGGLGNGTPETTTIVRDSLITGNQAVSGAGFFVNAGNVELIDSLVLNNQATENGGGIALAADANLTVDSSSIVFNNSEVNGGGIASLGGNVNLNDSQVFGNEALSGDGGGIFSEGGFLDADSSFVSANSPNDIIEV